MGNLTASTRGNLTGSGANGSLVSAPGFGSSITSSTKLLGNTPTFPPWAPFHQPASSSVIMSTICETIVVLHKAVRNGFMHYAFDRSQGTVQGSNTWDRPTGEDNQMSGPQINQTSFNGNTVTQL